MVLSQFVEPDRFQHGAAPGTPVREQRHSGEFIVLWCGVRSYQQVPYQDF